MDALHLRLVHRPVPRLQTIKIITCNNINMPERALCQLTPTHSHTYCIHLHHQPLFPYTPTYLNPDKCVCGHINVTRESMSCGCPSDNTSLQYNTHYRYINLSKVFRNPPRRKGGICLPNVMEGITTRYYTT